MFSYFLFVVVLEGSFPGLQSQISGNITELEDQEYVVSVQAFGGHMCGGSIISSEWIVTAAHCFSSPFTNLFASLGIYSIRAGSFRSDNGGEVILVRNINKHMSYNRVTRNYDIALIRLRNPVIQSLAKPIEFAAANDVPEAGSRGFVTGWFAINEDGLTPRQLQRFDIEIVDLDNCRELYMSGLFVTDNMLCARGNNGSRIPCDGNFGGQMVINEVLTGIVSKEPACWASTDLTVFTSIPRVSTWIRETAGL